MRTLRHEIAAAEQRFNQLSEEVGTSPAGDPHLTQALQQLSDLVEELRAAYEELQRQADTRASFQATLEGQQRRYSELFELAPDPYLITTSDGIIQEVNRAAAEVLKVPARYLKGKPLHLFIEPGRKKEFFSRLLDIRRFGQLRNWEIAVQPRQSPPLPASISATVSFTDPAASLSNKLEFLWLLHDLSHQRKAEEEVRESEEKYRSLFENALEGICRTTPEGRYITANPALARMLGYQSLEELLSLRIAEDIYMDPVERERLLSEVESSPEKAVRGREVLLKTRNGRPLVANVSIRGVLDSHGKIVAFESLVQDVTGRKSLEERLRQRDQLATVGATLALLAHEISNPLTGMSTTIEVIQRYLAGRSEKDETLDSYLSDLRVETRRLATLLHDFRLFAHSQYAFEPVLLNEIVTEILKTQGHYYTELGVTVKLDFAQPLPTIMGDKGKLKQALLNLCNNAVEAMPDGGTLTIAGSVSGPGVLVEVRDTGTGIANGVDIFEPFLTTKGKGTGLGLPIVRQVAVAHGGTVAFTSEPGKGTNFRLFLPIQSRA